MSNETLARVLDGADPAVRMQDDLFRAVNGTWIRDKEIPADLASYGSFVKLRLESEANVRAIIEDLASGEQEGDAKKISDLFSSWMDTDTLNRLGVAPLGKDLELVEAASSHDELAEAVGSLMATGVASFFSVGVGTDINDPSRYVTFLGQSGLGLPDEAYYREEQHAETLAKYTDFVPSLLELSGIRPAASAASDAAAALRLEAEFASTHMTLVERRDPEKYNNPFAWPDFVESAPGFAWEKALRAAGAPMEAIDSLLVSAPRTLTASAAIWARTDLDDLKAYTRWRILRARATFLTEEIDRANFDFYGKALRGTAQQRERRKRGVAAFEERTRALVAQYDAYVPAELGPDGPHVNGRLTLGENIGDLGGLSIALKAYEIALEREGKTLDDAEVLDGHTAAQRFFLSYARSWREKMRREFLETTVATDEHPPSEFRANGVVKNIDAFAEAFGLQPGDALYLPPEERVRIW